jgi:hypothetical protein
MKKAGTDIIRRVYIPNEGAAIEVGTHPDSAGDWLELRTTSKADIEYFGKCNITLTADLADELGRALIAAAKEAKEVGSDGVR